MIMSPRLRTFTLTVHLTFSIGWVGAVLAFLGVAVASVTSRDVQMVRGSCIAMGLMLSYVIVPLAFAGLLSGLVLSLATKWGLFRHYWVIFKFLLTVVATVVLLQQMDPIGHVAAIAADPTASLADLGGTKRALIHAAGGLVVLLIVQVLGVYKPRGLTRYGWRKQRAQRTPSQP